MNISENFLCACIRNILSYFSKRDNKNLDVAKNKLFLALSPHSCKPRLYFLLFYKEHYHKETSDLYFTNKFLITSDISGKWVEEVTGHFHGIVLLTSIFFVPHVRCLVPAEQKSNICCDKLAKRKGEVKVKSPRSRQSPYMVTAHLIITILTCYRFIHCHFAVCCHWDFKVYWAESCQPRSGIFIVTGGNWENKRWELEKKWWKWKQEVENMGKKSQYYMWYFAIAKVERKGFKTL